MFNLKNLFRKKSDAAKPERRIEFFKKKYRKDTKITPFETPEKVDRSLVSDIKVKPIEKQIEEMD